MPTCGRSPQPRVGPRPGKTGRGRSTVFSSGKAEVWGRVSDKYVCIWKQAVFQVSVLILLSYQNPELYW